MTDHCSKGEPPDVAGCYARKNGIKYTVPQLREEVRKLRKALTTITEYTGDDPYQMQITAALALST